MTKIEAAQIIKDWLKQTANVGKALEELLKADDSEEISLPADTNFDIDDRFIQLLKKTFET